MIELHKGQFLSVCPLLNDFQHCIPLNGVLDGSHAGRVFVDNAAIPSAGYVWTPWGYHYLLGNTHNQAFMAALRTKLAHELLPQSAALGEPDILLTVIPETEESNLEDILPAPPAVKLYRSTFTFDISKFLTLPDVRKYIPPGYTLSNIDDNLAMRLKKDICATWRSVDEFLAEGFGTCLLDGSEIVSVCLSAFVARDEVEIGVRTAESYRRRGCASLTAAAMIMHCLEKRLSPHWECFWDNKPSIGLAHKLRFEKEGEVPIYYWQGSSAT